MGSMQVNESFNNIVVLKYLKNCFYGGFELIVFRVVVVVLQKNIGYDVFFKVC